MLAEMGFTRVVLKNCRRTLRVNLEVSEKLLMFVLFDNYFFSDSWLSVPNSMIFFIV